MKFILTVFLALSICGSALHADVRPWLTSRYEVTKILSNGGFTLNFNGMTVAVRLVSVKISDDKKTQQYLEENLLHKKITVIPEESAGTSPEGLQLAYAIFGDDDKKMFVNEELIKAGWATYTSVDSEQFAKLQAKLLEASIQQTSKSIGKIENQKAGSSNQVCSELYSKKYHLMECRWAKLLNPQSRILYDSFEAAEKAEKFPCSQCLYERVKELRTLASQQKHEQSEAAATAPTGTAENTESPAESETPVDTKESPGSNAAKPIGGLIGIKSDSFFYSPVSKKLAGLKAGQFEVFKSLAEAKSSGRKPDPSSLRIDNPVVPAPVDHECCGRALPYLRPCRRDSAGPSGLCEPCLNGRIK